MHSFDFNFVFNSPNILGPVVVQSVKQIRVEWFSRLCQFRSPTSPWSRRRQHNAADHWMLLTGRLFLASSTISALNWRASAR